MSLKKRIFSRMKSFIKSYYRLTKPGIIYGNLLVASAGFIFASAGNVDWTLFFTTLAGLACIIASGCVFNNIYDRNIDARMERTRNRALVVGHISPRSAFLFGSVLGILGVVILYIYSSPLALFMSLIGLVVYVGWYTPLKHKNPAALFVGAVAGAVPPVVGYVAVTNAFDLSAVLLFLALYIWQIGHFLAISVYRYDEYAAAGVPLYIKKSPSPEAKKIAKKLFFYSLVVLLLFCLALMLQRW
jgi:heme o synthase